jgi:lysophospholipid acyltransferase (LPLAT)-like uncharacterized protein
MSLQGLKLALAPPAWSLLSALAGIETVDPARLEGGPVIFACLHRDILPAIIHVRPARPALMVSPSPDGDILVRTLAPRGYRFVRGATGEGGGRALVGLRRELQAGHPVGVAVDGPKGPYGEIHEGIWHLARNTGAPILALRAVSRRALVLSTWDRTVVPLPWGGTRIEASGPYRVANDADQAALGRRLTAFFEGAAP